MVQFEGWCSPCLYFSGYLDVVFASHALAVLYVFTVVHI